MGLVTIIGGFLLKLIELLLGESGGVENEKIVEQNKKLREKIRQDKADEIHGRINQPRVTEVKKKIVKEEDDDTVSLNPGAGFNRKLPKP